MTIRFMGRTALALVATACLAAGTHVAARQLAMEPLKDAGQNIYPAFEGWYQNEDGTLHAADRLLQPQQEADARYPDWPREPD